MEKEKKDKKVMIKIQQRKPDFHMQDEITEDNVKDENPKIKNEDKDEFNTTDVKAVRRAITNVYSRGTYNPAA